MAIVVPTQKGEEAVARAIAGADSVVDAETVLQIGRHRPLYFEGAGETLPTLRANEGDLGRAVERVWSLLMASNQTPWVYRFASQLNMGRAR